MKPLSALMCCLLLLTACGTVQHSVNVTDEKAFSRETKVLVGEVSNKTGESFDIDIESMLREALVTQFTENKLLGRTGSPDVVRMDTTILEYRKGDAFKRWLMPGYGSTVLVVQAALLDAAGNVAGTAQAKRTVEAGGGYTIGAWKRVFTKIASDLASALKREIGENKFIGQTARPERNGKAPELSIDKSKMQGTGSISAPLKETQPGPPINLPTVADNQVTIGTKRLELTGEQWFAFSKRKIGVRASTESYLSATSLDASTVPATVQTAVQVTAGRLNRVVVMSANDSPARGVQDWSPQPCKQSNTLYMNRFASRFEWPECLFVRRIQARPVPASAIVSPVLQWATSAGLGVANAFIETVYANYTSNGFLHIHVFAPKDSADDTASISWARRLTSALRPLATGIRASVQLPK